MRSRTIRSAAAPALALALVLAGCGTQAAGPAGSAPPTTSDTAPRAARSEAATGAAPGAATSLPGAYLTLAEFRADPAARAGTRVVYFFHAPWCPTCRATERAIGETGVPDGLTVVKVDFDTETALRQRYGVTQQHTFVQVGPDGAALGTWTGSADGAAILAATV
jgi:thioredoxin 1